MSSLGEIDKRYLEKLLAMQGGFVLDYSDATFGEFFARRSIEIHGAKYQKYGTSKAKKLRAFWDLEADVVVATILSELLDVYQADCDLKGRERDAGLLEHCRAIVARLSGKSSWLLAELSGQGGI